MKQVLLIGLGRFGYHVARKLDELGHQVMAVDRHEEKMADILPYVANAQTGDSTDEDFLKSLGVKNFDVCIVAIGDDFQSSLLTVYLLKQLGAKYVVARAARERQKELLLRNGADEVVYPEKQLAEWTAITYSSENIFDYIDLGHDYAIYEVSIPREFYGKTVGELQIRQKYKATLLAIKEDETMNMEIHAETRFVSQKSMLVLGKSDEILKYFHIF